MSKRKGNAKGVTVGDLAGLIALCNIAVVDNGTGKQLLLNEPDVILHSIYADAVCERITVHPCAISLWLHHDEVVRVTGRVKKAGRGAAAGKRRYIRKCGVCGERAEQEVMHRTAQSPNGWLCHVCLLRAHPEYAADEF